MRERHVQVLHRHGEEILRDRLLRVGVEIAAHGGGDAGQLIGGQSRAAPKHHVLQRVGGARKPGGAFIRTDAVIDDGGRPPAPAGCGR